MIGSTLPFVGYIVSKQGVQPNQDRVAAIRHFPSPKDQTGIKYFLGLANQLNFFIPDFAHHTKLMRDLLGKGKVYQWLQEHEEEFVKVKSVFFFFFFFGVPQRLDAGDLGRPTRCCYLVSIYHTWDGGSGHRASLMSLITQCAAVLGGLH